MKVKSMFIGMFISAAALSACNSQQAQNKTVSLKTEQDSVSYSLGVYFGQTIKTQGLDTVDTDIMTQAIKDVMASKPVTGKDSTNKGNQPAISAEQAGMFLSTYFQGMQQKKSDKNKKVGQDFLAQNKTKAGVKTLPSGLQYKVLKAGNGPKPAATDTVVAHYTGKLLDGEVFDTSLDDGRPLVHPANQLIPGWTEALQLMPVGSKWELYVPSELAYGERGAGQQIGPHATLIFEMELLGIGNPASTKK